VCIIESDVISHTLTKTVSNLERREEEEKMLSPIIEKTNFIK